MSEPHTADLGTRYRYRQEGAALERERIIEILKSYAPHLITDGLMQRIKEETK